ncbi:MAG: thioredoxin family protein [Candidatus Aminicenantes bacterium]|nr:thioredoxin family protein [Candidatus Aminicenantes bacterium]
MTKKFVYAILVVVIIGGTVLSAEERINREAILSAGPEWEENHLNYQVDEELLATLKTKIGETLKIDVYLGLWCRDSKENLPKFIKIMDTLNDSRVEVNYFTCERKADRDVKYFVEELKITHVPTFIFYRDGQEIGRIVENPTKSLIQDMIDIL